MMSSPDRPMDNIKEMHRYKQVLEVFKRWMPAKTFTFSEGRIRIKTEQFSLNDAFLDDMERNASARIAEVALPNRHPEWGLVVDFIVMEKL